MRRAVVAAFCILSLTAAYAAGAATSQRQPATRIETDQKTGTIRFIVDGKEAGRIDKDGLHVLDGIYPGGGPGALPQ